MRKKVGLTVSALEKLDCGSVWVLNKTNPRGALSMVISGGMGERTTVTVPSTYVPIDLSTQSTKQALVSAPEFRRMTVPNGRLVIISEEDALTLLAEPGAQAEAARAHRLEYVPEIDASGAVAAASAEAGASEVSGFALNLVMSEDSVETCMAALRNQADTLNKADFDYIALNHKQSDVKTLAAKFALDA